MKHLEAPVLKNPVIFWGIARTPQQANEMIGRGYLSLGLGCGWLLLQRGIASSLDGIERQRR